MIEGEKELDGIRYRQPTDAELARTMTPPRMGKVLVMRWDGLDWTETFIGTEYAQKLWPVVSTSVALDVVPEPVAPTPAPESLATLITRYRDAVVATKQARNACDATRIADGTAQGKWMNASRAQEAIELSLLYCLSPDGRGQYFPIPDLPGQMLAVLSNGSIEIVKMASV